jgi:uncharacterized protein (DUF1499 family)
MFMMFLILSVFTGSLPSDFETQTDQQHPFEPCPGTPNCIIHSVEYDVPKAELYSLVAQAIKKMDPHELSENSETSRIDAVFRIPVFGFKDDVEIAVEEIKKSKSVLHIKSASRIGYGDLGVNSRRVKRFLNHVNEPK